MAVDTAALVAAGSTASAVVTAIVVSPMAVDTAALVAAGSTARKRGGTLWELVKI